MLQELREERQQVEEAIVVLERMAVGRGRRRGRPPASIPASSGGDDHRGARPNRRTGAIEKALVCCTGIMRRLPLWVYVVGVIIALAVVNGIAWFVGGAAKLRSVEIFSTEFLFGMLAMYIAVHVCSYK